MNTPTAWAELPLIWHYRTEPGAFRVTEHLAFEFAQNSGEHLYLYVQKCGENTAFVARQLARFFGVTQREVNYAGMKDRHAVTRQWFSVHLPGQMQRWDLDALGFAHEQIKILRARWHRAKLRRGALSGNSFELRLECQIPLDSNLRARLQARIEQLSRQGFPNYFGPQRFGHGGSNLHRARSWFERGGRVRSDQKGLLLSAVRSYLFNQVLAERVRAGSWNLPMLGDCFNLQGSSRCFKDTAKQQPDPENVARCRIADIHPTGPMFGIERQQDGCIADGLGDSSGPCAQLEAAILAAEPIWTEGLAGQGLRPQRRPLRVMPRELLAEFYGQTVQLKCFLPAGSFATSLLAELGHCTDQSVPSRCDNMARRDVADTSAEVKI